MYPKFNIDIYYKNETEKGLIFFGTRDISKNIFDKVAPHLRWTTNKKLEDIVALTHKEILYSISSEYNIPGEFSLSGDDKANFSENIINYINNFGSLHNFYVLSKNYFREFTKINNSLKYFINNFNHLEDIKSKNKKIYKETDYNTPMVYMDLLPDSINGNGYFDSDIIKDSLYSNIIQNEEDMKGRIDIFDNEEKNEEWNKKLDELLTTKYIAFAFATKPIIWEGISLNDIKQWEEDVKEAIKLEPNTSLKDIVDEVIYQHSEDYIENSLWDFHEDAIENVNLDEAEDIFSSIKNDLFNKQKVSKSTYKKVKDFNNKKYVTSYSRDLNEIVLYGNTNIDNELNKLEVKINELKLQMENLNNIVDNIMNYLDNDKDIILDKDANSINFLLKELEEDHESKRPMR